jgi:hypothetical protein
LESPSFLERVAVAKKLPRLGISWAFPWAWRYSQVCRGPEELEGEAKLPGTPGATAPFSAGGGEVARYVGRHGTKRLAKAALISAVPPLMLKTAANPGVRSLSSTAAYEAPAK